VESYGHWDENCASSGLVYIDAQRPFFSVSYGYCDDYKHEKHLLGFFILVRHPPKNLKSLKFVFDAMTGPVENFIIEFRELPKTRVFKKFEFSIGGILR
jgi:hypothetical protein